MKKKKTTMEEKLRMKEKLSNLIALRNKVKTVADETAKLQKKTGIGSVLN